MTTDVSAHSELSARPLSDDVLSSLGGFLRAGSSLSGGLRRPTFDRRALSPSIVHIGVGRFHRAHQAVYLDDLAGLGHRDWAETGVGLRSPAMREVLHAQDCLFTVVEHDNGGASARVIGSMTDYLYGPESPRAVLDVLADPRTRMVTLTITGDGYNLDDSGEFRGEDSAVRAELADPGTPSSVQGYLVEALQRRRRAGLPGFTVLSCDNLPDNGAATRATVLGYARLRDGALADWIDKNASFPSSMVDRITPVADTATQRLVAEHYGVHDRSPVITERFRQWVVEDAFANGRPPLEDVGVQMVSDVTPYALVKKRLLNGSHSALAYLGQLAGHRTTSDAMSSPLFAGYLRTLMRDEIAPLVPEAPGVDLAAYQQEVLQRFANVKISDDLARLCGRGSTKMPAYLLPSLTEARRQGRPTALLTLAVAGWFRYLRGYDLDGFAIDVVDVRRDTLRERALAGGTDPRPLLALRSVFGDLGADPVVVAGIESALCDLEADGVSRTLRRYLAAIPSPGGLDLVDGRPQPRVRRSLHAVLSPVVRSESSAAMSA